ncbi:DUF4097 family beta strand repeat-containing protein [Agromyces sp. Marseille-P2726]|uniref:DUF4097 family beta strand repeat-containing protein n=1 Tax=Agromyces sp. Marseille-P2726 TaxID=2709132 RepID=UPI00156E6A92|nr:DUF4097 family beta strand repeat-containing protein [Agromyces sp. Marseille-P2726]
MHRMLRTAATAGVVTLAVGALSGCVFLQPVERFSDETTLTESIATIEIDEPQGDVVVRGDDSATEVTVSRTVSYRGDRPSAADETHSVDGDVLTLSGCGRNCKVDYEVELPVGVDVRGSTSNGEIHLTGVARVEVSTNNGDVDLEGVSGSIDVGTSNGRITGEDLNGDGIRAETSNGAIELEVAVAQDIEARTSNGSIELTVPADSYRVTAETSNGRRDIGVANDSDGRFTLDLHTSNGSITVEEGS